LDAVLDGGYTDGELVELQGEAAVGKSQACLAAAAAAAVAGCRVLYFDTSGAFSAKRVLELANLTGSSGDEQRAMLGRIEVRRLFDIHELIGQLHAAHHTIAAESGGGCGTRLVVVDSLAAVALPVLSARHGQGHALLASVGRTLLKLAHELALTALVTNFSTRGRHGEPSKPALGASWVSGPSMRLLFQLGGGPTRCTVTVVKSNRLPVGIQADVAF
jgi:RecA/RadA recombinase